MRPTVLIRTVLALATTLVLAGTLLAVSPASSAPTAADDARTNGTARMKCSPPSCWIAGAVNPKTGYAYQKWNQSSRKASRTAAMRQCKRETPDDRDRACRRAGTNRNGCLAIAYRARNGNLLEWAWAGADYTRRLTIRETKRKAVRSAKRQIRGPGKERIWIANCTAR